MELRSSRRTIPGLGLHGPQMVPSLPRRLTDDRPQQQARRQPEQNDTAHQRRIVKLRHTRHWGPARIAYHLGLVPSTVHRVLRRYRMPALACLDQATGLPVRRMPVNS